LRAYRKAIALKPEFGEVYWSMANLKVFRFEESEVAAMEGQLGREGLTPETEVHFRFALGKAYEDLGDYDRAWEFYHSGNQKQRELVFHDPVGFEVRHEEIIRIFSREFLEAHAGHGFESDAPILIVGLPRSGSTLIEQILASHSQVEGTLELATLGEIAVSLGRYRRDRKDYPEAVLDLRAQDFRAYGRQYIEETRVFRSTGKPRFTDKLPNNFSHVGFAHLILPNARIINARRHPLDSCLGSYKQLFGKGQNFTYDMVELGLYYRQYHETMRHWHQVLPGKVLDVHYEETVGDLEGQVRRILDHCGLPFEDACLRFHETQRPVRTASSEQVRQPLYTRALGTWRRYEKHLGPWKEELADIIAELPESVRNAGL
jgi:tetratricopeptide (TPR) repeat protein